MSARLENLRRENRQKLRYVFIGCLIGCVIAYSLLIAAKLTWVLPDYDWRRAAWTPLFAFGFLAAGAWFSTLGELREARRLEDLD